MSYLGDFTTSNTIYVYFNTFDSNDPSASVTLTGLAVTDIEIYKNGSTTQRASDAGYTLLDTDGIDFDTITGVHGFSIDLSDNTDAGFFAAGAEYVIVVSSVTVDAATINFIAGSFSIERSGGVLALAKGSTGFAAIHSDTTIVVSDTTSINTQTTTIASDVVLIYSDTTAIHSDTTIIASDVVQIYSDTTIIVSDTTAINTQSTTIASDVVLIYSDTTAIHSDTTIISSDVILIYSDTTAIESTVGAIATGTADSGSTTTMVDAALTQADTDYWKGNLIKFTSGSNSGQVRLITAFTPGTDTITFYPATTQAVSTNTYEILPMGGVESIYSDTTVITSDLVVITSDTTAIHSDTTIIASDIVIITSDTTAIHSDTTIIASDVVQIYSDTTIIVSDTTAINTQTTTIASDLVQVYSDTTIIASDIVQVYSDTTIVVSDTTAINTQTTTIASDLVLVYSDTTIIASDLVILTSDTTAIQSKTDSLTFTVAGEVDANPVSIAGDTTAATNLSASALGIVSTTVNDASASTTAFVTALTEATDDHYNGRIIVFTSGALAGQATDITDYAGSTKTVTVTALTEAPANSVSFVIV